MKNSLRWLVFGILMLTVSVASLSTTASAQIGIGISVRIGPPALPVYAQPICPGPGYLWTPGYWAWSDDGGYYWVPGTWVIAPVGMLWTPGYWGWGGGFYHWHPGYWGPHVGFYGGINYGYGYTGVGFFGGEWRGREFFYNRSVVNVNVVNVRNVYTRTVVVNNTRNVSFNGPGGIEARPTRDEERFSRERHTAALSTQTEHERSASRNRELFASENHGRPGIAATGRPGDFSGRNVERAREAGEPYREQRMSPREARGRSENDRRFSESSRNTPNERATTRPDNRNERNRDVRNNNAVRNNDVRNNNNEPRSRGQMASRERSNPTKQERAAQKQERQAQKQAQAEQKRADKVNRAQARAEQKRNGRDQHR